MASIEQNRVYLLDKNLYGNNVRTFLGIQNSAVVSSDDGSVAGYAGDYAKTNVVDVSTQKNGWGNESTLPLDFRVKGIELMTAFGIPAETQQSMFANFMTNYTADQRSAFVAQFQTIDLSDTAAVQAFVNTMMSMLT